MKTGATLVAFATAALACSGSPPAPILGCEPVGNARPVCGFQNPEDLAPLPGGRSVLVSEYGGMEGERPGAISLLDLDHDSRRVLFRGAESVGAGARWGDPDCPGPPAEIDPHGIDLARRPDGALELLVVQHARRESIEFFQVLAGHSGWGLAWRGCALAPDGAWFNDVVALPDGGLLVTHVMPRRSGPAQYLEFAKVVLLHMETGHVLEWHPGRGFAQVPGTDVRFANGIEVTPNGETIFLDATLSGEVLRIDRRSGRVEGRAAIAAPDNVTWAADGRLWVASLRAPSRELMACGELEKGSCPAAFAIVALDPRSLATEVIYQGDGPPMGAGTVGVQVGDELLVGSFAGDRVLRVDLQGRRPEGSAAAQRAAGERSSDTKGRRPEGSAAAQRAAGERSRTN